MTGRSAEWENMQSAAQWGADCHSGLRQRRPLAAIHRRVGWRRLDLPRTWKFREIFSVGKTLVLNS